MAEQLTRIETEIPGPIEVRDVDGTRREADIRLWSWTQTGGGPYGAELIARGATILGDPVVLTKGHGDTIVGTLARFEEREDGAYGVFEFEDTQEGLDAYKLAKKRTYRWVSPAFEALHDKIVRVGNTAVKVYDSIRLRAVGLTWKPAYAAAQIMQVREQDLAMADEKDPKDEPKADAKADAKPVTSGARDGGDRLAADLESMVRNAFTPIADKFAALEDAMRKGFSIPSDDAPAKSKDAISIWLPAAIKYLSGEKIGQMEMRALADITTSGNLGIIPESAREPIEDTIDASRPFMESTRQVDEPEGMNLTYPRIVTRPVVGTQTAEKTEVASGPVSVTATDYPPITIAGAADISIQLLRKSSPSFLQLFLALLGEAYAKDADNKALDNLIAAGPTAGNIAGFDPANPKYGEAFTNGLNNGGMLPDRVWVSPTAAAEFIDAGTQIGAGVRDENGVVIVTNLGLSLRPVLVPAMEDEAFDVLIGPSRGFAWAESPEMELQADVPGKLGRDVALARMVWFAALHPDAFTTYALAA